MLMSLRFLLLVGCCEVWRLGVSKAIIESDSFYAIQWGSGKSSFPWCLVDCVEEIKDVSRQFGGKCYGGCSS